MEPAQFALYTSLSRTRSRPSSPSSPATRERAMGDAHQIAFNRAREMPASASRRTRALNEATPGRSSPIQFSTPEQRTVPPKLSVVLVTNRLLSIICILNTNIQPHLRARIIIIITTLLPRTVCAQYQRPRFAVHSYTHHWTKAILFSRSNS